MFTTSVQELRADPDVIMEAMNQDAQVEKPSSRNRNTGCVFVGRGGLFLRVVSFKKKHREAFKFAAESVKSNRILGLNHGYIALASCGRGFKV